MICYMQLTEEEEMKQTLKNTDENICVSQKMRREYASPRTGIWKSIKSKMNRRHRKEGKQECQLIDEE